ncbi:MAG: hypothetical protein KDD94_14355, partial [Calditrichaeota bacterium]|nr:hypothetical protein [Calditrichota bacterium]
MLAADLVEVEFKGNRKDIYSNSDDIQLKAGDHVIVRANKGIDLGRVIKIGRLVRIKTDDKPTKIVRLATTEEEERLDEIRKDEIEASIIAKQKIEQLKLDMKLVD